MSQHNVSTPDDRDIIAYCRKQSAEPPDDSGADKSPTISEHTVWCVVSPEDCEVEPAPGCHGDGPLAHFCHTAEIEAPTKREAIRLSIQHPDMTKWVERARGDNMNPFTGLRAELLRCEHGVCHCDDCVDARGDPWYCEECMAAEETDDE